MKIRVRPTPPGGQTFKIDFPATPTLQALREAVGARLSLPHPAVRLSFNKRDEIAGPPDALLTALGVCSGDLLFCLDAAPAPLPPAGGGLPVEREVGRDPAAAAQGTDGEGEAAIRRELCATAAAIRRARAPIGNHDQGASPLSASSGSSCPIVDDVTLVCDETGSTDASTEIEDAFADEYGGISSNSIPVLFRRVLLQENGKLNEPHSIFFLGIHAVMLETGFVHFDPETGVPEKCIFFSHRRNTKFSLSLSYTLPEIIVCNTRHVVIRLQTLGNSVVTYGTLTGQSGAQVYRLCLKISDFISVEKLYQSYNEGSLLQKLLESTFLDLPGFWKEVKDGLSIRLLTDLCESAGLPVPASLLILPTELKMRILEALSAFDLLRTGCTCSEFRHLAANDNLWRQRFIEEIGFTEGQKPPCGRGWKDAFFQRWAERKRRQRTRGLRYQIFPGHVPRYGFPSGLGSPHFGIGITGGDYDRFPVIGGPRIHGSNGHGALGGHLRGMHLTGHYSGLPVSMSHEIDALPGSDLTGLPESMKCEINVLPGTDPPNLVTRMGTDGFLGDFLQ